LGSLAEGFNQVSGRQDSRIPDAPFRRLSPPLSDRLACQVDHDIDTINQRRRRWRFTHIPNERSLPSREQFCALLSSRHHCNPQVAPEGKEKPFQNCLAYKSRATDNDYPHGFVSSLREKPAHILAQRK
jgi:hypothetical protein